MRESIWAHGGESSAVRQAFWDLSDHDQDCVIEFLKTLQVLPEGSRSMIVDENGKAKTWPPKPKGPPKGKGPFRQRKTAK